MRSERRRRDGGRGRAEWRNATSERVRADEVWQGRVRDEEVGQGGVRDDREWQGGVRNEEVRGGVSAHCPWSVFGMARSETAAQAQWEGVASTTDLALKPH